MSSMIIISI